MTKALFAACSASALLLFAAQAQAADVTPPAPEASGFYVSLFGGASFLNDVETDYNGNNDDQYTVEPKTGYILGGVIGTRIWDPLRAEIEVSYSRWEIDDEVRHNDHDDAAEGHLEAVYLLGNLWYDFDMEMGFTPYVGGGAGVGFADADTLFNDQDYGYGDGDAGFAFQLGAGAKIDLTENIAFDVGYRFKGILDVDYDDNDGEGSYEGADLYSHNVQAGIIFGF